MKNQKKHILLTVIALISLIVITVGVTYAFFNYVKEGSTENSITTANITFLYTEVSGVGRGISISNAFPVSDEVGKAQVGEGNVFDFKVTSTTPDATIPYEVTARKSADSTLPEEAIKLYLTEVNGTNEGEILLNKYSNLTQTEVSIPEETVEKTIYTDTVPANSTNYEKNFRLRMWISDDTDFSDGSMNGKTFTITVNVYANAEVVTSPTGSYTEAILNGTDPVLTDNLVPVMIAEDGTVTKANIQEEWYSYENKNWANAVVLKDNRITYQNGETIPEDNIESYFVWIPKYSYQIWDLGDYSSLTSMEAKEQVINIQFGLENTSDGVTGECSTPGVAGASGSCEVGDYMTHPAFLAFDTNGLWVGKFETGYDGATITTEAEVDSSDSSKIIIKPNVYSWRSLTLGNMFEASYNYLRSDESHIMKNTEWGAVAYLQHSAYGSATSVRINNNLAYITGYAATEEPTLGYNGGTSIEGNRVESTSIGVDGTYTVNYLNSLSSVASTTGNYTGVYDMSGGAWEFVMGYSSGASATGGSSGITSIYPDFFTNNSWTKYYDKYSSTKVLQYNNRILGDATGELGPSGSQSDPDGYSRYRSSWYEDYGQFVNSSSSFTGTWFYRGGRSTTGNSSGNFAFSPASGAQVSYGSFRIVLAP